MELIKYYDSEEIVELKEFNLPPLIIRDKDYNLTIEDLAYPLHRAYDKNTTKEISRRNEGIDMKSILLIGLGRFGKHIAMHLNNLGHQVMAVDNSEDRVEAVLPFVTNAQIGDSTNAAFLESLGIRNYDVCIVAIGNDFQSSLETTSLLKELGAKLVVSRAATDVQEKFLLRNGADEVVYPEKQLAKWTAIRYSADHILDYIELDSDHAMFEIPVPENCAGRSIGQIDIRKEYNINIIGIKKNGKLELSISPDLILVSGETMLVLGRNKELQKCFHISG